MKFRKLRIAWSVVCGIVCVLLIVLWVRSNRLYDLAEIPVSSAIYVETMSQCGRLVISIHRASGAMHIQRPWYHQIRVVLTDSPTVRDEVGTNIYSGIGFKRIIWADGNGIVVPYWFIAFAFATFGTLPWIKRRFSLRTLLIATTLIAVVLGAIVYVTRN